MKKTTQGVGAILAGLAMLTLAAASAPAADPPGFETYVVRRGDTLSRIAGRVLGDTGRWREILKANPQVTNANRIYPGDSLLVPVPETAASAAAGRGGELAASAGGAPVTNAGAGTAGQAPAPSAPAGEGAATPGAAGTSAKTEPQAASPTLPVRPRPVVSQALYRSAGSIVEHLPTLAIVAAQDDREMLASGDEAIVNAAMAPGERFTVVRADRRVFHPRTGEYLGWLVQVLGTAEVTCRAERTSTVLLAGMRFPAGVGDYLVPLDPNDALAENVLADTTGAECIPPGAEGGVIVAFEQDHEAGAEQDFALLDRGSTAGVAPGSRFVIYREILPENRVKVGELQVLRVAERTSTALITASFQEVQVGDLLRAR